MSPQLARFPMPGGELIVLGAVQGLVAEADRVREAVAAESPLSAIALGVSPEAAATLTRYQRLEGEDPFEDIPDHDYAYSLKLEEFGPVDLPPPDLLAAARLAGETQVPVYGIDLTEEAYVTVFTREVSAWQLFQYGRIQKRLARKPPKADSPRAFSLAWDAAIRRVKGIGRVEAAREAHIAEQARTLVARTGGRVLLVVDVAREAGILARLGPPAARLDRGQV